MSNNSILEKELIDRLIEGSESAFREIFYLYKDKLLSYCFRFTKSEAIAEEIVHDVLLKIWTDRKKIDRDRSFNSYLYTITRNHSLNFLKKAAANNALKENLFHHLQAAHCQAEEEVIYQDLAHIAEDAIALLPPQRRLVYQMSRRQAMSYEEIANRLGISKFTVKNHMVKALKSIKDYLTTHAELNICLIYALFTFLK